MKVIPVAEAATQLASLITDALNGEAIFVTNGANEVRLTPCSAQDSEIDFDSPELEALLLEGLEGPTMPYSHEQMKRDCQEAVAGKRKSK
jgi:hypothetical protein